MAKVRETEAHDLTESKAVFGSTYHVGDHLKESCVAIAQIPRGDECSAKYFVGESVIVRSVDE